MFQEIYNHTYFSILFGGVVILQDESRFLVLVEVVKVKNFIFSSSKLKSIRGASYVLDEINLQDVKEIFHSFKDQAQEIYFGGGNNKVLFNSRNDAQKFVNQVEKKYREKAPGVRVLTVIEEKPENEDLSVVMNRAEQKIKKKKREGYQDNISQNPFAKKCTFCGEKIINHFNEEKHINSYLCVNCQKKVQKGNMINRSKQLIQKNEYFDDYIYNLFFEKIKNKYSKLNTNYLSFAEELNDIAAENKKDNYIGFIYADGNRLGSFLTEFSQKFSSKEDEKYIKEQRIFSKTLDQSTKEAVIEAVIEVVDPEKYIKNKNRKYPVEFIIAGGDDLIVVVPGDKAIELTHKFTRKFQQKVNKKLKTSNKIDSFKRLIEEENFELTISSGISICKPSYPMEFLFDYTTELQKEAKKRSNILYRKFDKHYSTVDFDIITSSKLRQLKEKRKKLYRKNNNHLTLRPYVVLEDDEKAEFHPAFALGYLISRIKILKKESFPMTKLRQFYDVIHKGREEAVFESIKLISKLNKKHKKIFTDLIKRNKKSGTLFPWFKQNEDDEIVVTDMIDVLESYNFIDGGE